MCSQYAGFNEGFAMLGEMFSEVKEVLKVRPRMSEERWRRVFLRSVFALLEAFISKFKGRALEVRKHGSVQFPEKLLRILEEGGIVLRDGAVWWEEIHPRTRDHITATMKAYAKAMETVTPMGGELALPEEFTIALGARNRVTHPKIPNDLKVTEAEIAACVEIFKWLMASIKWSGEAEQKSLRKMQAELNENADAQMEFLRSLGKSAKNK